MVRPRCKGATSNCEMAWRRDDTINEQLAGAYISDAHVDKVYPEIAPRHWSLAGRKTSSDSLVLRHPHRSIHGNQPSAASDQLPPGHAHLQALRLKL